MKAWKVIGRCLLVLLCVVLVIAIVGIAQFFHRSDPKNVKRYDTDNPFITGETAISAHRSGAGDYPEETLAAFRGCVGNPDFAVDGVRPFNYIINDAQPDADGWSMDYYVSVLCHEFGHCLGLPDYYYLDLNAEETSDEADGLKGAAGLEMMDDMEGDYSQFSRLMLGYLDPESVQIYRGGEEEFLLTSAQRGGGCLILPRDGMGSRAKLLWGEYFLVEYNTGDGNLSWYADEDFGVRIFHVNAETVRYGDGTRGFTYDDALYGSVDGRRVLRLVREAEDYLTGGEVVDSDTPGFAWYDAEGRKTVDPGLILRFEWDEKGRGMYCIVTPTGK